MSAAPSSPNRARLVRTARQIEPLLADLVFVGGQMAELLVTDRGAVRVRPTDDVDVIVRVTTRSAYHSVQRRLVALGFNPDSRPGAPMCRLCSREGLVLDVMPLDEAILGFSNRWYPYAIDTAAGMELEPGLVIRAVTAPAFLATKWEAFAGRGAADPLMSHDLEDIVTLMAGRSTIVDEVRACPTDVRAFLAQQARAFLSGRWAAEIVEGSLPEARHIPGLVDAVFARFRALAGS